MHNKKVASAIVLICDLIKTLDTEDLVDLEIAMFNLKRASVMLYDEKFYTVVHKYEQAENFLEEAKIHINTARDVAES